MKTAQTQKKATIKNLISSFKLLSKLIQDTIKLALKDVSNISTFASNELLQYLIKNIEATKIVKYQFTPLYKFIEITIPVPVFYYHPDDYAKIKFNSTNDFNNFCQEKKHLKKNNFVLRFISISENAANKDLKNIQSEFPSIKLDVNESYKFIVCYNAFMLQNNLNENHNPFRLTIDNLCLELINKQIEINGAK
jgi:hypothetical protein